MSIPIIARSSYLRDIAHVGMCTIVRIGTYKYMPMPMPLPVGTFASIQFIRICTNAGDRAEVGLGGVVLLCVVSVVCILFN